MIDLAANVLDVLRCGQIDGEDFTLVLAAGYDRRLGETRFMGGQERGQGHDQTPGEAEEGHEGHNGLTCSVKLRRICRPQTWRTSRRVEYIGQADSYQHEILVKEEQVANNAFGACIVNGRRLEIRR